MGLFKKIISETYSYFYWLYFNKRNSCKILNVNVPKTINIGKHVMIRRKTEIGIDVSIGDYSYISGPINYVESAIIGKYCSIARQNIIGVSNHNYNWLTTSPIIVDCKYNIIDNNCAEPQKPPPLIGNDVWIGVNCVINRGIIIGDGAVIAAGSVVTKNIPPYAIVGGAPAKILKYRFSDQIIEQLLEIKWWDWPEEKIKKEANFMYDIDQFIDRNKITL